MFFSVKTALKIAGKVYIPCVCYPLPEVLAPTIDKLVGENKAVKYEEHVFFQNGAVIKTEKMLKEEKKEAKKVERKTKKEVTAEKKEEVDLLKELTAGTTEESEDF